MKKIKIKNKIGVYALIDDEFFPLLSRYTWSADKRGGYACSSLGRMHNVVIGESPTGMEVDHINQNKLDNRFKNLRFVTHQENCMNRKQSGTGVSFRKERNKWRARVKRHGKEICIGHFTTENEALKFRKLYLKKLEAGKVEPKLLEKIMKIT